MSVNLSTVTILFSERSQAASEKSSQLSLRTSQVGSGAQSSPAEGPRSQWPPGMRAGAQDKQEQSLGEHAHK